MSYRDRQTTARFRNLFFKTDSFDHIGGRRLVVHQYPGAENPNVEDMGGKAWDHKLAAYFIGPDYDLERDAFLKVLNQPGEDLLIHPTLGTFWVRVKDFSIRETTAQGGLCTIQIEFVPGGSEIAAPTPDLVDIASESVETYNDAVEADYTQVTMNAGSFDKMVTQVQTQLEGLRNLISMASLPLNYANQILSTIQGIKGDVAVLLGIPQQYANALRSLMNAIGLGLDDHDVVPGTRSRIISRLVFGALVASIARTSDPKLNFNINAEQALRNRLMLGAAAQIALTNYTSSNERDAVLDTMLTAIDALLPSMADDVFQEAVSLRKNLINSLLAQDLKPTRYRDVVNPFPSALLAYQMGVSEANLIAQNDVQHPLFVNGRIYA